MTEKRPRVRGDGRRRRRQPTGPGERACGGHPLEVEANEDAMGPYCLVVDAAAALGVPRGSPSTCLGASTSRLCVPR